MKLHYNFDAGLSKIHENSWYHSVPILLGHMVYPFPRALGKNKSLPALLNANPFLLFPEPLKLQLKTNVFPQPRPTVCIVSKGMVP